MSDEERPSFRMSGDAGVGQYEPQDVRKSDVERLPSGVLDELRAMTGLAATVSDVLEELGWQLSVPASTLQPRHKAQSTVVGHALTLLYLPLRRQVMAGPQGGKEPPHLAHHVVFRLARPGDVMVIDASATEGVSVMGGIAAAEASALGLSGVVVDGGLRDLDQARDSGLPIWTRYVTPRSGKYRLDGVAVNGPVTCGGVQVVAGDLVVADWTGVCFVPREAAESVIGRVREVTADERSLTA